MTNLFDLGTSWLADQLKAHASIIVDYVRGNEQVTVQATVGKTEFEIDDGAGAPIRVQSRDYLIQAADLQLSFIPILPVAGDLVHETVGDQTFVYEVNAPGNEPPYRYSDPFRKLLRIHTKHVATQ